MAFVFAKRTKGRIRGAGDGVGRLSGRETKGDAASAITLEEDKLAGPNGFRPTVQGWDAPLGGLCLSTVT
jgi:hypothetical protein